MTSETPLLDDSPLACPRQRTLAIGAAIACIAIVGMGLSLSIPLLSLEMGAMGASSTLIGASTAVAGVASIIAVPFIPRLAARVGVAPLLWASVATACATLLAFKATYDILLWFPLRFVFSVALTTLFVLSEFWINTAAPPARRGLIMGIYATVLSLGFAAGPAVLYLTGVAGWAPYVAGTGLFALAALPLLVARGLTPGLEGEPSRGILAFLLAAPAATLAAFVFGAVETGTISLLPIYGLNLGWSAKDMAFLLSLMALGNVLFQIPIGLLSDRCDRRLLLFIVALVGAAGAAAIPLVSGDRALFGALLIGWGGMIAALYTVGLAHLGARFSGADLAGANAAFVLLYHVGLIAGAPAVGLGMDRLAPHGFAHALTGFFLLYVAVVGVRLVARRGGA